VWEASSIGCPKGTETTNSVKENSHYSKGGRRRIYGGRKQCPNLREGPFCKIEKERRREGGASRYKKKRERPLRILAQLENRVKQSNWE